MRMNNKHVNAYIVSSGTPYILGEYVDNEVLQAVDRSLIVDNVVVDMTESMRPVIDISIDTIGKNASDGLPSIIGNNTRYQNLIELIKCNRFRLDGKLPLIKSGITVRIFYQLENNKTGHVIRSMVEDLQIGARQYYLDINSSDINDNAIITNFTDSIMSTINHFTQGRDQMVLRITSIQLCYDLITKDPVAPRLQGSKPGAILAPIYDTQYQSEANITPTSWYNYDRFYHFDVESGNIILHQQEIDDLNNKILRIPCKQIQLNRYFIVNPGSRIIFKFSIWQNDVILVNDSTVVMESLGMAVVPAKPMPYHPPIDPTPKPPYPIPSHHNDWGYNSIERMYREGKEMDNGQNMTINKLSAAVRLLIEQIKALNGNTDNIEIPEDLPTDPRTPIPMSKIRELELLIRNLQIQIHNVKETADSEASEPNVVPMSIDDINDAINDAVDDTNNG